MRKILCVILCLALLLSFSACGNDDSPALTDAPPTESTVAPSEDLSLILGAVEESFVLAMDSMISGSLDQLDASFNYVEAEYFRNYAKTDVFNRVIYSELEYNILSVEKVSDQFCSVTVEFTNVDVYNVIRDGTEDWLAIMEGYANADTMIESSEIYDIMYTCFIAQIPNYTSDKITSQADVLMSYSEEYETWQVVLSDTTIIAIVGSEDAILEYLV